MAKAAFRESEVRSTPPEEFIFSVGMRSRRTEAIHVPTVVIVQVPWMSKVLCEILTALIPSLIDPLVRGHWIAHWLPTWPAWKVEALAVSVALPVAALEAIVTGVMFWSSSGG